MAGLIARLPYPSTDMTTAIGVLPAASGGSCYALVAPDPLIITKDYGEVPNPRPSQRGDVLSWCFDHWEGRPGAQQGGPYETYALNGGFSVYCPDGKPENARGFATWANVPNVV
jgi:hypothetical protein